MKKRYPRIYSLGYQGITIDQYVEALISHNIEIVIDVRETPWSYKAGFSRKPLNQALMDAGITYVHLRSAGNPKENRRTAQSVTECLSRYQEHLANNPACLNDIVDIIESTKGGVCLTCYEYHPNECHRSIIIDALKQVNPKLKEIHLSYSGIIDQVITASVGSVDA
ncbi:MAG: DUF488 domain-containing protein [Armatimonadetes bacterium]|nr:DUF488 domain-containing protein [Armatimonadota bacterium]